jgi:hypothetical protein
MHDDVAFGPHAARLDHRVALQAKYFALIENFTPENFRALSWQIRPRWLNFKYLAPIHRAGRA